MAIVDAVHDTQDNGQPIETVEYWEMISIFKYHNITALNSAENSVAVASEIVDRIGMVEVLRRNGPEFYRFRYGHSIISYGSKTDSIATKIELFDNRGKLQKAEVVFDQVNCNDNKRRTIWSFTLTQDQSIVIEKSSAELDGQINWKVCEI